MRKSISGLGGELGEKLSEGVQAASRVLKSLSGRATTPQHVLGVRLRAPERIARLGHLTTQLRELLLRSPALALGSVSLAKSRRLEAKIAPCRAGAGDAK